MKLYFQILIMFTVSVLGALFTTVSAQTTLTYDADGCVFTRNSRLTPSSGHLGVMGFNGLSMTNGSASFKVRGGSTYALYIYGTQDKIRFYNPLTGRHNAIWADEAYIHQSQFPNYPFVPLTPGNIGYDSVSDVTALGTEIYPTSDPQATGYEFVLSVDDIKASYPQLITTDGEGNNAVDYNALLPLLVASIQKSAKKIESQKQQIAILADELAELNSQNE